MSKKAIILLIMVIIWMGLIFYMSNSNGDDSGSESEDIVTFIIDKYDKITNASIETISYHKSPEFIKNANFYFRKMCHFSEYFILGILLFCFLIALNRYSLLKCVLYSILISILYACSDEFRQTFINGRSGQIIDILIDCSGAIIGVILIRIVDKFTKKRHKND